MTTLRYTPLSADSKQIRLLYFEDTTLGPEIDCAAEMRFRLRTVDLEDRILPPKAFDELAIRHRDAMIDRFPNSTCLLYHPQDDTQAELARSFSGRNSHD